MEDDEATVPRTVQAHEEERANGWKAREWPVPRILVRPIDGRFYARKKQRKKVKRGTTVMKEGEEKARRKLQR